MAEVISRHEAKVILLTLLIRSAELWTFDEPQIPQADQEVLRSVRDQEVKQLKANLTFVQNANRK